MSAVMVGTLVVSATSAVADEPARRPDSAFGVGASGLVPIEPVPSVVSHDGTRVQKSLLRTELGTGVFTVSAQQGRAEASVASLNLAGLLRADQVRTWCADGSGGMDIIDGAVLGTPLPRNPIGNDTVSVSPLVKVELNHQIAHDDGTLTVEGLALTVLPGAPAPSRLLTAPEKAALPGLDTLGLHVPAAASTVADVLAAVPSAGQKIVVGSVTCGRIADQQQTEPGQQAEPEQQQAEQEPERPVDAAPAAPKPRIVKAHLPVTG
ncbi:MAG TPA: choice-of-anchor P family protein [Pseudonocardia sp.]